MKTMFIDAGECTDFTVKSTIDCPGAVRNFLDLRSHVAFREQKRTVHILNQTYPCPRITSLLFLCVGALAERGGKGLHTPLLLLNKEGKTTNATHVLILCYKIIERFLHSWEQVLVLGKSSLKRATRFRVISTSQILALALANTPKAIAPTNWSNSPNIAGSVNSRRRNVVIN